LSEAVEALLQSCEKIPLDVKAVQRDAKLAKAVLAVVDRQQKVLEELKRDMEKARYEHKRIEEGRTLGLKLTDESQTLCKRVHAFLTKPAEGTMNEYDEQFDVVDNLRIKFQRMKKNLRDL
jgi:hypothetical protein